MIVFPSSFLLAAADAGVPATNARVGWQSYARGLAATAVTASSAAADGPADAPLRPDTADYWQPTALPATWIVDFGKVVDLDYVGIAGHDLSTRGCGVDLHTSIDAGVWVPFSTSVAPADDSPRMFLDVLRQARLLRLTLTGLGTVMPKVASLYAGKVLAMEKTVAGGYQPITMARETVLYQAMSRGGQFLGQGFRRNGVVGSAMFKNLTSAWVRANFDAFAKSARSLPYFFAWNPSLFPDEVGYVWSDKDIVPTYMGQLDNMEVSWKMRGIGIR